VPFNFEERREAGAGQRIELEQHHSPLTSQAAEETKENKSASWRKIPPS
jgi:hypothetical protein